MRARLLASIGGISIGALLVVTVPAEAGRPLLAMTLDPTEVVAGTAVTATPDTDNECPGTKGAVALEWALFDNDGLVTSDTVPVTESGAWGVEIDTTGLAVGEYTVEADCVIDFTPELMSRELSPAGTRAYQSYSPEVFTVIAGGVPEPEFDVTSDKAAGPAGSSVQLSGVECVPGLGSSVAVKFMPAGPVPAFDNTDASLEVYEVSGGDASFSGSFVVPAGTAAGTYQFVAWCLGEGGQVLEGTDAQVLGFTVTAPGAVAVAAAPRFAG